MLVNLYAALATLLDYCIIDGYVLFGNKPVVSKLPTLYYSLGSVCWLCSVANHLVQRVPQRNLLYRLAEDKQVVAFALHTHCCGSQHVFIVDYAF